MNELSPPARAYVMVTIVAGAALAAYWLSGLTTANLWVVLLTAALASFAQVAKVEGATDKSSYNIALVAYGFAFVALGTPAAVLVILVACVADWVRHRYPWFIQTFNIAVLMVAATAVGVLQVSATATRATSSLAAMLVLLGAVVAFVGANHLLVGTVILLARGEDFQQSGVFDALTVSIDATLLGMGIAAALLARVNPWASLLAVAPLFLVYRTLKIPSLQRQATTDPKTGLYNARYFSERLQKELERADRYDRPLTVVMADLDLLRNINNTYGHLAGDSVLMGVARTIRDSVREYDVVARVGGEEFAVIMGETGVGRAKEHVEAIRAAIEVAGFDVATSATPIRITMSFGVAEREGFGNEASAIMHNADLALYQAKLEGRNRVCIADADSAVRFGETRPGSPDHGLVEPVAPPVAAAPAEKVPEAAAPEGLEPGEAGFAQLMVTVAVASAAAVASWLAWSGAGSIDRSGLAALCVLAVCTELLSIDVHVRNTSVSTSAAPFVAGVLLFGMPGVLVLSFAVALTAMLKHRSPLRRFVFNASTHALAGSLIVRFLEFGPAPVSAWPTWEQLASAVLGAGAVFVVTTALVSTFVGVSQRQGPARVWVERFAWLASYYLAFGLVAFTLVWSYLNSGVVGLVVVVVPLALLRASQVRYVRRTSRTVTDLRGATAELEQRARETSELSEELLLVLSRVVDLRDPYMMGHALQVSRYATVIAEEMSLPAERIELVRRAAMLHDIGKIGLPEAILFKPDLLSTEEYEVVKVHSAAGADIVAKSDSLRQLVPLVRHHHERFDGGGYPDRLAAHDIPLEARVLSVADAVEAMASDRPYRAAMSAGDILDEVKRHSGTQFDPAVIAAFQRLVERKGERLLVNSADGVRHNHEPRPGFAAPTPERVERTGPTALLPERAAAPAAADVAARVTGIALREAT